MSLSKLIEPGDAVVTTNVEANFNAIATTVAAIKTENIENNSIRTRHISTGRGEWKEITVHTNAGPWTHAASTQQICPAGATDTSTKTGQMVLVVATVNVHSTGGTGTTTCSAEFQLKVDNVVKRTMTVKDLGGEKLQAGTMFAFEATADKHEIDLFIIAGVATFSASNAELQVIAVRG